MEQQSEEIVGWIFRCDLCGFDETRVITPTTSTLEADRAKAICIVRAIQDGWVIRDLEHGGCRCPKCVCEAVAEL